MFSECCMYPVCIIPILPGLLRSPSLGWCAGNLSPMHSDLLGGFSFCVLSPPVNKNVSFLFVSFICSQIKLFLDYCYSCYRYWYIAKCIYLISCMSVAGCTSMYSMPIPVVYDIFFMCNVFWVLYVPCVHIPIVPGLLRSPSLGWCAGNLSPMHSDLFSGWFLILRTEST